MRSRGPPAWRPGHGAEYPPSAETAQRRLPVRDAPLLAGTFEQGHSAQPVSSGPVRSGHSRLYTRGSFQFEGRATPNIGLPALVLVRCPLFVKSPIRLWTSCLRGMFERDRCRESTYVHLLS